MFIDKKKLECIDIILLNDIFKYYRDKIKLSICNNLFDDVSVTVYEESLMNDFLYYYMHKNNYNDFKLYYYGHTYEDWHRPIFYIISDKDFVNYINNNYRNIQKEIMGALILNILFSLISNKSPLAKNLLSDNLNNIDYIRIVNKLNINYLLRKNARISPYFDDNIYNYIFNWIYTEENEYNMCYFMNSLSTIENFVPIPKSEFDDSKNLIFSRLLYNILCDALYRYGSITFDLFQNDFLLYIKYKDSSNIIITNFHSRKEKTDSYNIDSTIKLFTYKDDLKLDEFIVEFNYYNLNKKIKIDDDNIITHDQLFTYNNIIKPWAQKNIYPKINNINIYRYSGISPIINEHIYKSDYVTKCII